VVCGLSVEGGEGGARVRKEMSAAKIRKESSSLGGVFALLMIIALTGCESTQEERPVVHPATRTELTMRAVPEAEWERFLAEVVVARFPTGVTVLNANGHRSQGGRLSNEASRILVVVHPSTLQNNRALEEVRREFKARFGGEVLRSDTPAAVSF
jgi:hypothetical protein